MNKNMKYSICICNYNMEDTIEESLESLLSQLDENFEVLLVDDGSSDNSVDIVKVLQKKYKNLRLIELKRDKNRKLGFTRNISIREAQGEYVLLHLDCDDRFGPYIIDFVKVFHKIEKSFGYNILLSGQHVNMANRNFLLKHGPYLNIFRGEDRNLWARLAKLHAWVPLKHIDFIERMKKNPKQRFWGTIWKTFDAIKNDFRSGVSLKNFVAYQLKSMDVLSLKLIFLNWIIWPFAYFFAKFESPIPQEDTIGSSEAFAKYRDEVGGYYAEIMSRNGADPSLSFLENEKSREIFEMRGV